MGPVEPVEPIGARDRYEWEGVARGGILILLGTLTGNVMTLLFQMVAARSLEPDDYGALAMGISVSFFVSLSIGSSIGTVLRRFAGPLIANADTASLRTVRRFCLSASVLFPTLLALPMVAFRDELARLLLDSERYAPVIAIFAAALVVNTIVLYQRAVFQAYVEPGKNILHAVVFERATRLLTAAVLVGIVTRSDLLRSLSWAYLGSLLLPLLLAPLFMLRRIRAQPSESTVARRDLLRFMTGVFVVDVVGFALDYADIFMVGGFLGPREVGLYTAALAIGAQPTVIVSSIAALFLPAVSAALGSGDRGLVRRLTGLAARRVALLSVPAIGFLVLFSGDLLQILFGPPFKRAGWVLVLVALSNLFFSISGLLGVLLYAVRRMRAILRFTLVAAGTKVVVGVIAIPVWGIRGAAIANLCGILVAAALRDQGVRRHAGVSLNYRELVPFIWAGVLVSPIPILIGMLGTNPIVLLVAGLSYAVGYAFLLIWQGHSDRAELKSLVTLYQRKATPGAD